MPKKNATKKSKNNFQSLLPTALSWEAAIAEAERQIRGYREKITKLKAAIRYFQEKIREGEPFPMPSKERKSDRW